MTITRLAAVFSLAIFGFITLLGVSCSDAVVVSDVLVDVEPRRTPAAVLLVDAKNPSGCMTCPSEEPDAAERVFTANPAARLGNLLQQDAMCRSEVVAFSHAKAMFLAEDIDTWTDARGDTFAAMLRPPLAMPITIWVIGGGPYYDPDGALLPGILPVTKATADVARALYLYNGEATGITFGPVVLKDVRADPAALGFSVVTCDAADYARITGQWFTDASLNIYYVDQIASGHTGYWCAADRPSVIFVAIPISDAETLAHELGHAFFLEHVYRNFCASTDNEGHCTRAEVQRIDEDGDGRPEFPDHNIMVNSMTGRRSFSLGQAFRMNVAECSELNLFGLRGSLPPLRECVTAREWFWMLTNYNPFSTYIDGKYPDCPVRDLRQNDAGVINYTVYDHCPRLGVGAY